MKNLRYSIIATGFLLSALPALAQQTTKTPQASFKIETSGIIFTEDLSSYAKNQLRWLAQGVKRKGISDFTLKIQKTDFYPKDKSTPITSLTVSIDGIPFVYNNNSTIRNNEHALLIAKEGVMAFVQKLSDEDRKI
jgi:hypothetical protein